MKRALITGGAGFFGSILKKELLRLGWECVSIDLQPDDLRHPHFSAVQGDIRDLRTLDSLFSDGTYDAIFHCAAILAHVKKELHMLWTSNVDGTRNVAKMAEKHRVPRIIFTSSNCLWGEPMGRPVTEEDSPHPVELYGRSKLEGEKILLDAARHGHFKTIILRCPTIMDCDRLGLLTLFFTFVDEGRKVWVVGNGENRYQFIYAMDLVDACVRAAEYDGTEVFNIGSDHVTSLRSAYELVIRRAKTGARVASLPRWLAIPAMKTFYALGLSPLGPYQYNMIAEDFIFDTRKIKQKLGWRPTLTNEEMLWKAYEYYHRHRKQIEQRKDVSAHRRPADMGIIRLLKAFS